VTLEAVLAEWVADAAVLRRQGYREHAERLERMRQQVADAAEDLLRFLPESNAMLKSSRSAEWLHGHFAGWEQSGDARKERGVRYYRAYVVPQRSAAAREARAAGQRAASLRGRRRAHSRSGAPAPCGARY